MKFFKIVDEVLVSKKGDEIRILEHLLLYTESQFVKEMTRIGYRERADGTSISDWVVEIFIICDIHSRLAKFYRQNDSISCISRENARFPYLERSLSLLSPLLIHLDSDGSNGIDSLSEDQIHQLLSALFATWLLWLLVEGTLILQRLVFFESFYVKKYFDLSF